MRSAQEDWSWEQIGRSAPTTGDSRIEIVSSSGKVLWATDPAAYRRRHDRKAPPCRSCHGKGTERAAPEPRFVAAAGRETGDLFAVPLENEESCRGCHGGERAKLGTVLYSRPLSAYGQLVDGVRLALVIAGLAILAVAALGARLLPQRLATPLPPPPVPIPGAGAVEPEPGTPTAPAIPSARGRTTTMELRVNLSELEEQRDSLRILYGIAEELAERLNPEDRRRSAVQLVTSIFNSSSLLVSGHSHPQSHISHGLITYCQQGSAVEEVPYPCEGIEEIAPYYNQRLVDRWLRGEMVLATRVRVGGTVAYPLERHGRRLGLFLVPALPRTSGPESRPTVSVNPDVVNALRKHLAMTLELAELQRERLQQERLAAIGATVAGLAHCLKNTLNGLKGGQYVVERAMEKDNPERLAQGWRVLKDGVRHIERLTFDMLLYAADRAPMFEPVAPGDVIQEVVDLLEETARYNGIELVTSYGGAIGPVPMDRHTLYRALLNLATNAIDACVDSEEGDRVTFRSKRRGSSLVLTVEDNGVGIPPQILQRVTERFFTTKTSKGTGLGLPVVQKIAELHGGTMEIESVVGQGSKFHIVIPYERSKTSTPSA